MSINAIKSLLGNDIINEDTRNALTEAWEVQLAEAREEVRSELREEFARRYEHDKNTMVVALDKMVTEALKSEIAEFRDEKNALVEDRVKFKSFVRESGSKFNNFMVEKLSEEIKDLREDRKVYKNSIKNLEKFIMEQLASEIREFAQDKKDVVATKVRLVSHARTKMAEMKRAFIDKSSTLVKEAVTSNLKSELNQLKEDIHLARENMFGRKIFEAFASEFTVTHLNENKEIAKLSSLVNAKNRQLEEARRVSTTSAKLVETKDRELKIVKEAAQRKQIVAELLKPLSNDKAKVMSELLENTQTNKLRSAYDKYLPSVLNETKTTQKITSNVLTEDRKVVTGDKTANKTAQYDSDNVIAIKRLAGLK